MFNMFQNFNHTIVFFTHGEKINILFACNNVVEIITYEVHKVNLVMQTAGNIGVSLEIHLLSDNVSQ